MKTKYFLCAIFALIAVSCSKEQQPVKETPVEEGPALVVSATTEQPGGTKTSLDGLNVKWTVGDKIYLTDGTNAAIYQATNNATSTSFSYVSGSETLTGDVYAYYPAGNVDNVNPFDKTNKAFKVTIPATQAYKAGGFADGVNPMTAYSTVVDGVLSLQFKNVMSFVKLQIADSEANKVLSSLSLTSTVDLCGTATIAVSSENATAGIGSISEIASGVKTVELAKIDASLSAIATAFYIAVPAASLGNLTITAITSETTGCYSQTKTASSSLTPQRSSINSYNAMNIASNTVFSNKTLCSEAPANCYMINAASQNSIIIPLYQAIAGWDAIKALEPEDTFDKTKITSGERTIAVRWLDGASGNITLSNINASTMTLALSCTNGTNAVVDLKNGSEIVWSWHLWFTDYKPAADQTNTVNGQVHTYSGAAFQSGGLYYGKVMMDRNLGATVTEVSNTVAISQPTTEADAQKYWGLFYQFGRKDPFATTGDVSVYDASPIENKKTYAQTAQDPSKFYTIGSTQTPGDGVAWCITDVSASPMTDPWNSGYGKAKSAFDPCPAGWRVPNSSPDNNSMNVWYGLTNSFFHSGSDKTAGCLWNDAWVPASGNRSVGYGTKSNEGKAIFLWSATPRVKGAGYYVNIEKDFYVNPGSTYGTRACGLSIRCVKD